MEDVSCRMRIMFGGFLLFEFCLFVGLLACTRFQLSTSSKIVITFLLMGVSYACAMRRMCTTFSFIILSLLACGMLSFIGIDWVIPSTMKDPFDHWKYGFRSYRGKVVWKLVLLGTVWNVWLEKNCRIFNNQRTTHHYGC